MKRFFAPRPSRAHADYEQEPQVVLTPTEARQASPRKMNFVVLIASMTFTAIAAAVLYTIFYGGDTRMSTPDPAPTQQTAPGP